MQLRAPAVVAHALGDQVDALRVEERQPHGEVDDAPVGLAPQPLGRLRAVEARATARCISGWTVLRSQKPLMLGLESESGTKESQPSRPSSRADGAG